MKSYIVKCIRAEFLLEPKGFGQKTGHRWLITCISDSSAAAWTGGFDYVGDPPREVDGWSPVSAMLALGIPPENIWNIGPAPDERPVYERFISWAEGMGWRFPCTASQFRARARQFADQEENGAQEVYDALCEQGIPSG